MHLRQQVAQPIRTSYRYIPLTQNQIAIVDAENYEWLNQWLWYALWAPKLQKFYVCHMEGKQFWYMHRIIIGAQRGELVNHKDMDTLNNRRYNLRICTNQQNMANRGPQRNNTSGHKGVRWDHNRARWSARIMVSKKHLHLGRYLKLEDAINAYKEAAEFYFGEFAKAKI